MTFSFPTSSTPPRSHRIRSVSVIGGFLDGLRLELADGLNCFIGGRGTGKTTVMEFVRFAVEALPSRDEASDALRRIESLVEQNLAGGRVQVEFQKKVGRIADRTTSQLVVIDRFQADAIAEIDSQLRGLDQQLAANASQLLSL